MNRKHFYKFVAAGCMLTSASAFAIPTVDQSQPDAGTLVSSIVPGVAQSFQQDHANISGAGIMTFSQFGSSDTLTISLWDALPNAGGAHQLASGSATASAGQWLDVMWSPVAVVPNTTLFLVFSTAHNMTLGLAGSDSDPYSKGQAYWYDEDFDTRFEPATGFDYAFRTLWDQPPGPNGPGTNRVPDAASTSTLMTLGFAGLALLKKRRA